MNKNNFIVVIVNLAVTIVLIANRKLKMTAQLINVNN